VDAEVSGQGAALRSTSSRRDQADRGPQNSRETLLAWNKLGVASWAAKQFDRAIAQFEKTPKAM
jgi:hypothetical protein